jgi:hypothetical protein
MSLSEIETWVAWVQFQNDAVRKAQLRGAKRRKSRR